MAKYSLQESYIFDRCVIFFYQLCIPSYMPAQTHVWTSPKRIFIRRSIRVIWQLRIWLPQPMPCSCSAMTWWWSVGRRTRPTGPASHNWGGDWEGCCRIRYASHAPTSVSICSQTSFTTWPKELHSKTLSYLQYFPLRFLWLFSVKYGRVHFMFVVVP